MKKLYKAIIISSAALSVLVAGFVGLSASGAIKLADPSLRYKCRFYNEDGTFLYSCNVAPSHDAVYDGPTPVKDETTMNKYLFRGWDQSLTNITSDMSFHAVYETKKKDFLISFVNYDGEKLYEDYFEYGSTPQYIGEVPTRESSPAFDYVFDGWDPRIVAATKNATYTATYKPEDRYFTATFVNYDGTFLYKDSRVPYNGTAEYRGFTPVKESTGNFKYTFSGWDNNVNGVTEDTTFTAQFVEEPLTVRVTFLNYDDTLLGYDVVSVGESAYYDGDLPIKPSENGVRYDFIGWDKSIETVTEDLTVHAVYQEAVEQYTVTFRNYDDTILFVDTVERGETAHYEGALPTKPDSDHKIYEFRGWDRMLENVQNDFSVYPVFDEIDDELTVTFCNWDKTVLHETHVYAGETAYYSGETPTREEDETYTYEFKGWSVDVTEVYDDTTTYALFDAIPKEHSIGPEDIGTGGPGGGGSGGGGQGGSGTGGGETEKEEGDIIQAYFYDWDFTLLTIDQYVYKIIDGDLEVYGESHYKGKDLTREDSNGWTYTWTGKFDKFLFLSGGVWIEYDFATYEAYNPAYGEKHIVTFRNDDFSLLYENYVSDGEMPVYPEETLGEPVSKVNKKETVFTGWHMKPYPADESYTLQAKYALAGGLGHGGAGTPGNIASTPVDREKPTSIFSYETEAKGKLLFREYSYQNLDHNVWTKPTKVDNFDMTSISPLYFASDKIDRIGLNEYDISIEYKDFEYHKYSLLPMYSQTQIDTLGSDAYTKHNVDNPTDYTFSPLTVNSINLESLVNNVTFSNDEIRLEEMAYRDYAYSHYTQLDNYTKGVASRFVSENNLQGTSISNIIRISNFIKEYAKHDYGFETYPTGSNYIEHFLYTAKSGVASDFASALTAIYRSLGIPARYVTGYASESNGGYATVTTNNSYAWCEVYISNLGWIAIDGTPDDTGTGTHLNPYNPFGPANPDADITIRVSPDQSSKPFDGTPMTAHASLIGSLKPGHHLEANTETGESIPGTYVTRAQPKIFNEYGADVTSEYKGRVNLIYESYRITQCSIQIISGDATKVRDGTPLTNNTFTVNVLSGAMPANHTVSVKMTGSQTKPGVSDNFIDYDTLSITDTYGNDVTNYYIVSFVYGKLTVL